MKIYIKNMVSQRCRIIVKQELSKLNIEHKNVDLGMIEIGDQSTLMQLSQLRINLLEVGLEIIENKKLMLIETVKNVIIKMVHYDEELPLKNYSVLISEKIGRDYTYISNLFRDIKGITIQRFIIHHKIERVKELLQHDELNLTEISYKLNYSSLAHMSHQFKQVTGLSPSFFKSHLDKREFNLEEL